MSIMFPRLAGKTVLITGASGGIGAETAILFARCGANLVLTARRQPQLEEVAKLAKEANAQGGTGQGGQVECLTLDMQDRKAVKGLLDRIPKKLRLVDVLVNNAGLVHGTEKIGDILDDDIDTMIDTNVRGLITLTQIMVKEMKSRSPTSGHIINLGSIAGKEAYPGGAIYCATKFAVHAFTTSLMKELMSTRIRVTLICPGMVETQFSVTRFRGDKSAADQVYEGKEPLVAQDIAEEIVWAASRPAHVNIADVLIFPKCQSGAGGLVHKGPLA
ncbi:short-chain dehydrogenase [Microbotryum lychnidis-dioicae p1A1 Lamole]|uniref:Short-chain dehydrogenase n=2 Tax=Microbotryum TaxID=34416 RepID=U5GZS2_USTV1|nr:short-chain dehydrogenase [Microbotryum lychnidis-dioicae p1A1 Lamole]SGY20477.1 BQ5605_C016g08070 [Microbotryum silenes-dioicae]|eukprot:KDE09354.1 short-chain dehydrogenase [Microbotryum lychnidis-dioicae p1A1 Lamole]